MPRRRNSKRNKELDVSAIWVRGLVIKGLDPDVYRMDDLGRWMCFADYGDRVSHFGWEAHRRESSELDGDAADDGLRPRNWLSPSFGKAIHSEPAEIVRRESGSSATDDGGVSVSAAVSKTQEQAGNMHWFRRLMPG